MKRTSLSRDDQVWLKSVGRNIEALIRDKGYKSVYDFWVRKAGDDFARATLNYMVQGRVDFKATSVRTLAKLLGVKVSRILEV